MCMHTHLHSTQVDPSSKTNTSKTLHEVDNAVADTLEKRAQVSFVLGCSCLQKSQDSAPEEAAKLRAASRSHFRLAAEGGHVEAMTMLATVLRDDPKLGTANKAEASQWHLKAASLGNGESQYFMGQQLAATDTTGSLEWFKRAVVSCRTDNKVLASWAATSIANCLISISHESGVTSDNLAIECLNWLQRAIELGRGEALLLPDRYASMEVICGERPDLAPLTGLPVVIQTSTAGATGKTHTHTHTHTHIHKRTCTHAGAQPPHPLQTSPVVCGRV